MFAVRFPTAHGKQIVFVVHLVLAHGKGNTQGNSCQRGLRSVGKKCLSCANKKTHDKLFLCRALRVKRTANNFFAERFFAVRYGEDARQRSPLPCARKKTHDKDFRAWQRGRSP
jgi:hypothetical protein